MLATSGRFAVTFKRAVMGVVGIALVLASHACMFPFRPLFLAHADSRERVRDGVRKVRKQLRRHERPIPATSPSLIDISERPAHGILSPSRSAGTQAATEAPARADTTPQRDMEAGYIAEHSVLMSQQPLSTTPMSIELQNSSLATRDAILRVTEADVLPKQPLRQALIEAFFDNLYHRYPLVELEDVLGPDASVLLVQAVCMAGSLMKHWDTSTALSLTHSLYEKVKTLIFLRYEPDSMNVLKATCLATVWSPNPSDSLSLDSPWHWTGTATRLATQMGLHKQSSYSGKPDATYRRRIWWLLFVCAPHTESKSYLMINRLLINCKVPALVAQQLSDWQILIHLHLSWTISQSMIPNQGCLSNLLIWVSF